jgi:hypothetical protein
MIEITPAGKLPAGDHQIRSYHLSRNSLTCTNESPCGAML